MNAKASELIVREEAPIVPANDASNILQIIERIASNPEADINKLERLMEMHERMVARKAEAEFNDAMTSCQHEMRMISTDATNPQTKSRYATYAKLDKALRPIYTQAGFALSFDTEQSPKDEYMRIVAYASHRGGHTRTYRVDMPADGKGAKGGDVMTKTHAAGAAMSYGMRYLLKMIFNVAVGEEDKDGNDTAGEMAPEAVEKWVEAIEATTTKEAAKEKCAEAIKAADALNDLAAYKRFKQALSEHSKFIDQAAK